MNKVYSVYHAMEDRGVFEMNPANAQSVDKDGLSLYKGPVSYPRMLFHPRGELEVVFQGVLVVDPQRGGAPILDSSGNPRYTGTQVGVKWKIVNSAEEEAELLALGWHKSEAAARRLNPETSATAPAKTREEILKERIAELEAKFAEQERTVVAKKPEHQIQKSA